MAKIKTTEFTTYHEVGVAVDNNLVSAEMVRFAQLYNRYKNVQRRREEEIDAAVLQQEKGVATP